MWYILFTQYYTNILMKNILFLLVAAIIPGFGNIYAMQNPSYAIVVDAGSSGSRLFIYSYQKSSAFSDLDIKQVASLKVEPGISAYAKTSSSKAIVDYIKPLINFAVKNIPLEKQKSTTFTWYSTAGMRLVTPTLQQKTYFRIKSYLTHNTQFKPSGIETIPGAKEGALMWLSTYYRNHIPTGILDMGGASTQIVFPVTKPNFATVIVNFPKKSFKLYSKSYLGLGQNEIRHQLRNDPSCFSTTLTANKYKNCQNKIKTFLQIHYHFNQASILPRLQFIAYDAFYKTIKKLKLKSLNIAALNHIGPTVCANNLDTCFNTAYFSILLGLYGFKPSDNITIQDSSWTLGHAVLIAKSGRLFIHTEK